MILNNKIINIVSKIDGSICFKIKSESTVKLFTLVVFDEQNNVVYKVEKEINNGYYEEKFSIKNPNLWQLSRPYLYHYELKLDSEIIKSTFGIRKLSTQGKYITLNDKPLFIRGYIRGIEAHDHKNNCNLSEEEFYRKNIKTAKQFGFNFVRFHSTVPSEVFLKVADEEGILVHVEMRPPHDEYQNVVEMLDARMNFLDENFIKEVSNKLFNHPSFAVYCLGNEFKNLDNNDAITKIGKLIKEIDPDRLYLDTCAWGTNNRPLVDFDVQHLSYYFPFGKHADMYDDTNNLLVGDLNKDREIVFNVPLIAHEVCHYTALRDFKKLKEKYNQYNAKEPWWIDEEIKMIHEKGYDDRYPLMYKASKSFQKTCWKIAFEAMRSSKLLGGFMFLQFADTDRYENSNGIVDCFDDINGIKPEEFNIFNGDIVLLTRLNNLNYFDTDSFEFNVFISRFDEENLQTGKLIIKLGEQILSFDKIDISRHDFYKIANCNFKLPKVNIKTRLSLSFELFDGNRLISKNQYYIWVYPSLEKISYQQFISTKTTDYIVTDSIENALSSLKEEKDVVLIYRSDLTRHVARKDMNLPRYAFKASWNRFKPVIWDRGTNFGGIIDTNILSKYGYNEEILDLDFSLISEDSDKIILDDFPCKVMNLVSGIDKCNRDRFDAHAKSFNLPDLMYDRTLRDYSYLFAIGVGKAKLIVCGLNLLGLNEHEPSAVFLANSLIDLVNSIKVKENCNISFDTLSYYLYNSVNPVKERIMTQFWELDDAPVESKDFWRESREYLK